MIAVGLVPTVYGKSARMILSGHLFRRDGIALMSDTLRHELIMMSSMHFAASMHACRLVYTSKTKNQPCGGHDEYATAAMPGMLNNLTMLSRTRCPTSAVIVVDGRMARVGHAAGLASSLI